MTRKEKAVVDTLKAMEAVEARRSDRKKLEETIAEQGLSIEVARLRDRLLRLPFSDLQRLLLATPGVPEQLLWKAIEEQAEEEKQQDEDDRDQVKDETVNQLGDQLGDAIDKAFSNLGELLAKIIGQQQPPYGGAGSESGPTTGSAPSTDDDKSGEKAT